MKAARTTRTARKPGELGVVLSWPTGVTDSTGRRRGAKIGRVKLDHSGTIVAAQWSGVATMNANVRPSAPGQRVTIARDAQGIYRATLLIERVDGATSSPTSPPRRSPPPLSPTLASAVAAAVAQGESPWTIALRHNIDVSQVRRGRGLVHVCEAGRPGERYLLTGENLTMNDLVAKIAAMAGVEMPRAIPLLSEIVPVPPRRRGKAPYVQRRPE